MGNGSNNGQPHWSHPSMVLRDAERIRTRPTPSTKPQEDVTHVEGKLFEKSVPITKNTSMTVTGPNVGFGAKRNDTGGVKVDSQLNLGGVSLDHKTDDHHYGVGLSKGWGGGFETFEGEKPGFGFSVGPLTGTVRDKAFNNPMPSPYFDPMDQYR